MRSTITISIPTELKTELDRLSAQEGGSRSDMVRDSLRDYVFLRKFEAMRRKMVANAQRKGVFTDEDVFRRVS